jgi:hypothetical protein
MSRYIIMIWIVAFIIWGVARQNTLEGFHPREVDHYSEPGNTALLKADAEIAEFSLKAFQKMDIIRHILQMISQEQVESPEQL